MIQIPKDADILPPSDDHIFKTLLTHPNAKPVLMNLISSVIERTVVDVLVRNTELPAAAADEKAVRLDVNCVIDGGDQVNVEMQASHMEENSDGHSNFRNKYVYYLAYLHASQKSKGLKYRDLARSYQITFCTYTIFPEWPHFATHATLSTPDGRQISDQMNMAIIELSKLKEALEKPVEELTPLELWSLFFKFAPNPKHRGFVNKIISQKEEIAMATELLMEISQDERERALFMSRKKYETDMTSNLLTAEARGEARGVAIGEARGRFEVARNMKLLGIDLSTIVNTTGLTVEEVLNM